jgi:hypothetical protein
MELRFRVHLSNIGRAATPFHDARHQAAVLISNKNSPLFVQPYKDMASQWESAYQLSDGGVDACGNRDDATSQFVAFLEGVRARLPLGLDAYHIYPQVLKIEYVQWPKGGTPDSSSSSSRSITSNRFDGIGRVETLAADLASMRALYHARTELGTLPNPKDSSAADKTRCLHSHCTVHDQFNHSHATASCANVDLSNATVRALLCDIYEADYACFGYPEEGCAASKQAANLQLAN